ncbi:MAG: TonB-dependent receptor plug domain-containing protein [Leadbetterella sp.]|jgi:TonB-dependent SusC/RagA subfamily outer membrane receptor|nr:TonB-dependent receptor plug domain-containing protein [Leadbetterella sp.]MBP8156112.1 TonB-dependent receptor plug domain-containing protein [Leadbetterella sp.]
MMKITVQILFLFSLLGCVNTPNQQIGKTYVNKEQKVISDGYSSQNTKGYTGAADQVKDLGNNITLDNYLRRVAGVSVKGDGSGAQILIRGVNTFSPVSGSEPLFVVDNTVMSGGFSGVYQMINPNDISSVSVLKDASSTGIYGSRGANGVIVINLKKK